MIDQARPLRDDEASQGKGTASCSGRARYARAVARRIRSFLAQEPNLTTRYNRIKAIVRAFRRPAFYEVATRCNLKCEGCYYFEGGTTVSMAASVDREHPLSEWEQFFAGEAARGVSMAYFVGAEPALEQDRLLAAAPYFPFGNIGTNGTIKIDAAVPYRIGVSIWAGDDVSDKKLRGASVFRKALRNYRGDPRAVMLYTVTRWTINQIETVAEMCQDHDIALTFSLYSPTDSFLNKLAQGIKNDRDFFRVSRTGYTPILDNDALTRIHRAIESVLDRFPETIIYSHAYNNFMCLPGPRYDLDPETGVAIDCGSRIVPPMRYYTTDLSSKSIKCCTPDVDCATCRLYSGGWSSRFVPRASDVQTLVSFKNWLEMMETLGRIFLFDRNQSCGGLCIKDP